MLDIKERLEKLPKEKLTRFACDCALINIELIKPHTDKYDEIITFLTHPNATDTTHAHAAYAAYAAYAAHAAAHADAAAHAAYHAIRSSVSEDTILKHLTDIENWGTPRHEPNVDLLLSIREEMIKWLSENTTQEQWVYGSNLQGSDKNWITVPRHLGSFKFPVLSYIGEDGPQQDITLRDVFPMPEVPKGKIEPILRHTIQTDLGEFINEQVNVVDINGKVVHTNVTYFGRNYDKAYVRFLSNNHVLELDLTRMSIVDLDKSSAVLRILNKHNINASHKLVDDLIELIEGGE